MKHENENRDIFGLFSLDCGEQEGKEKRSLSRLLDFFTRSFLFQKRKEEALFCRNNNDGGRRTEELTKKSVYETEKAKMPLLSSSLGSLSFLF